jgi:hypothetical protein
MNIKHLIALVFIPLFGQANTRLGSCDFSVIETLNHVTCPNGTDGSIELEVVSTTNVTFQWANASGVILSNDSNILSNLSAGIYSTTVTDELGCEVNLDVEVKDGIDSLPPIIQCPIYLTAELSSGECAEIFTFQITAIDNCGEVEIKQTDSTGLVSGDWFPIGTTVLSFEASDNSHTVSCSFQIVVNEFSPSSNASMSCSAPLNVSVDVNCTSNFGAETFLTGSKYGCFDDYLVVFKNHKGDVITAADFHEYIEKNIYVTITDPDNGNSCQTILSLFDNLKPVISCVDTLFFSCSLDENDVHPSQIGYADVYDNCGEVNLDFYDQITDLSCDSPVLNGSFGKILNRTWTAVDEYGNFAKPCHQVLLFERKSLADVEYPKNRTDKVGDLPSLNCDDTDTSPFFTGAPMIDSISLFQYGGSCDISIDYSDFILEACGIGYDILRTWTIHDVCQNIITSHLQIIRIKDKTPPLISCQTNKTVSTNAGDCTAIFLIPSATVSDDCSDFSLQFSSTAGNVSGNLLMNVPLGDHVLTYTATDECGNQSQCKTNLTVFDGLSPTIVCRPSKTVSLTSDGKATISAKTFDNGSYDDCIPQSALKFEIRRLDNTCLPDATDWKPTATFCCADIGMAIPVEVRVIDYLGNYSVCGPKVLVTDQIAPALSCPSDIQVECGFDYSDLTVFGKIATSQADKKPIYLNGELVGYDGLGMDNCEATLEVLNPEYDINDCGTGTIRRSFRMTDSSNNKRECTQTITIINSTPFYINTSNFLDPTDDADLPPHLSLSGCSVDTDPNITGKPILLGDGCDLATFTFKDEIVNLPGNAWQIKRKWTIIDFCNYSNGQGIWHYTQYLTIQNNDQLPPQIEGLTEIVKFCSTDSDCGTGNVDFSLSATDNCTEENNLVWSYNIDLFNDGTIDIFGNANAVIGEFPVGIHRSFWSVTDEFGNESNGALFLVVEDCLPPTLLCADTVQMPLNDELFISAYAEDLEVGSIYDNCTDLGDLQFLVSPYNPSYALNSPPSGASDYLLFACPDAFHRMTLWVKDENHNWGFCHFELHIFDNLNNCGGPIPSVSIAGNVRTENGLYIEGVEVNVNTATPLNTDFSGTYAFYNLPQGGDFSVVPSKNLNPLNGVTTYDMVLIQKHILNIVELTSPYKIIAADINKSGTITTLDMVELKKLILNITPNFSNNNAWRFVDADFDFPNPKNPFETPFPENKSFNNLPTSQIVNFIGVKIGDVNNSVNPNNLIDAGDREFREEILLNIENQVFTEGQLVEVSFGLDDLKEVEGFQFSLHFDSDILEYRHSESKSISNWNHSNIGDKEAQNGLLHFSWNDQKTNLSSSLITLVFEAKKGGELSRIIHFSNDYLHPEIYTSADIYDMSIRFYEQENPTAFQCLPNQPNPFVDETWIPFYLPKSGTVKMKMMNASGRLIFEQKTEFESGWQGMKIRKEELVGRGVYFYEISTSEGKHSGKIILVD